VYSPCVRTRPSRATHERNRSCTQAITRLRTAHAQHAQPKARPVGCACRQHSGDESFALEWCTLSVRPTTDPAARSGCGGAGWRKAGGTECAGRYAAEYFPLPWSVMPAVTRSPCTFVYCVRTGRTAGAHESVRRQPPNICAGAAPGLRRDWSTSAPGLRRGCATSAPGLRRGCATCPSAYATTTSPPVMRSSHCSSRACRPPAPLRLALPREPRGASIPPKGSS
jgi:hypothetical protein